VINGESFDGAELDDAGTATIKLEDVPAGRYDLFARYHDGTGPWPDFAESNR
jgi:hypothetical protein